jgi:hypothetical protein
MAKYKAIDLVSYKNVSSIGSGPINTFSEPSIFYIPLIGSYKRNAPLLESSVMSLGVLSIGVLP